MERRSVMKWIIRGVGLATAGMVGIPSIVAGLAPLWISRPKRSYWYSIGSIGEFPVGKMQRVLIRLPEEAWGETLREKTIYAWRPSTQEAIVYSRSCTDLGCPLTFDEGSEWFYCPCHGGIFDKYGNRRAGPPSRPMYRYGNRIENGEILIDLYSVSPLA